MSTIREDIEGWIAHGTQEGRRYMLVVCDTFDHVDYPVYASTAEQARDHVTHPGSMQRVMEVYDLNAPLGPQLTARRAWANLEETS